MKQRCGNPRNQDYHHYGGRGIKICGRWAGSFLNFVNDMGVKPAGLTLERIDVNGDYEPSNCKWATQKEQMNNTRSNVHVILNGERLTLARAADKLGMRYGNVLYRLQRGQLQRA